MSFDFKKYRAENRDKLIESRRQWRRDNKQRDAQLNKNERLRLKSEALSHYCFKTVTIGSIVVRITQYAINCVRCGFSDERALQIDHIDDNGANERERACGRRTAAGTTFYRWLRKNRWPDGYQVLCANCNWIKEIERRGTYG